MKTILESLEGIPEALHGEYENREGKFYLKVEGDPHGYVKASDLADSNGKLSEFRETNRTLNTKVTELEERLKSFDGFDPEEHKKLKEKITELEKKGVKGADDITQKIQAAVDSAVKPLVSKVEDLEKSNTEKDAALTKKELESRIAAAAREGGVLDQAYPDFLNRALSIWKMDGEKLVARNGDTPIYSKAKPAEPMTIKEWTSDLSQSAPFLFKPSHGGGAEGGGGEQDHGDGVKVVGAMTDTDFFLKNAEAISKGTMRRSDRVPDAITDSKES